eukprot:2506595-Rhodomonas_salina.1
MTISMWYKAMFPASRSASLSAGIYLRCALPTTDSRLGWRQRWALHAVVFARLRLWPGHVAGCGLGRPLGALLGHDDSRCVRAGCGVIALCMCATRARTGCGRS